MRMHDNGGMKDLAKPIEFSATIAGNMEKATVHAIGSDHTDTIYRISFSNGYADFFHFNEEGFRGELPGSVNYAEAIIHDLKVLQFYEADNLLHTFRYRASNETNVWIQEFYMEEQAMYAIYYLGTCHFWLQYDKDRWKVILPATVESVDQELVRQVELLLNKLI